VIAVSGSFDAEELDLIRATLRHALDTNAPAAVPGALLAAGWADLVGTEPATAITELAAAAGRTRSAAPVADLAMLWASGIGTVDTTAVIAGGLVLAGADRASHFLVVGDDGLDLVDAAAVSLAPAGGFDPALGLSLATVDGPPNRTADAGTASAVVAAGRRAIASQMSAAAGQMLADTLEYVTARHQYGRSIGSFQSVKHRLADVAVAVAAAEAGVRAAWESADHPDGATLAIAAKCLAGRAQQLASTHCFQVHGGIAFTVEHGFQQWVRRGLLLDVLLGSTDQLRLALGRRLMTAQRAPRHPALRG
jgi:alkylation response protein AidB-like acyl-CoA dehydrogenase